MRAPIIFCHYGKSRYLKYSLKCARINNPDKEIVLLGDMTNRRIAQKCGVRHELFARYSHGNEIETFDRVYRLIKGKENRNFIKADRDWIKFVFKRWFFVHNFLKQRGIGPFWHFDSDNMILDSLSSHEAKFRHFDCTEQCNGMCMNGFVSGPAVVSGYINKINELFQRDDYLQAIHPVERIQAPVGWRALPGGLVLFSVILSLLGSWIPTPQTLSPAWPGSSW